LAQPFVPASASRLLDLLAVEPGARSFDALKPGSRINPGVALPQPSPVFPRYVETEDKE
jgi:methionyl-tRNA synthetase